MGISPESVGAVGELVNFVVACAATRTTAVPTEHNQHMVEDNRASGCGRGYRALIDYQTGRAPNGDAPPWRGFALVLES
jgi:hypothetical protein